MNDLPFIGRKKELKALNDLSHKKVASLAVIRGRRRIGKSRLLQEFTKDKKSYYFAGLPPEEKISAVDSIASAIKAYEFPKTPASPFIMASTVLLAILK